MMAAEEGHHECLSILLVHGAFVNKADAVSVFVASIEWTLALL